MDTTSARFCTGMSAPEIAARVGQRESAVAAEIINRDGDIAPPPAEAATEIGADAGNEWSWVEAGSRFAPLITAAALCLSAWFMVSCVLAPLVRWIKGLVS